MSSPYTAARVFIDQHRVLRALVISHGRASWSVQIVTECRTSVQHTAASAADARAWLVAKFGPGKFIFAGEIPRDEPAELFCDHCGRPTVGARS